MVRLLVSDMDRCVGCQLCMFACSRRFGNGGLAKSAILVKSTGGFERGFVIIACRACTNPPCYKVCPTDALSLRDGGGVILDSRKCIGCKLCVNACSLRTIFWDDELNKPNICVHCGYCVDYCPYDILSLKRDDIEQDDYYKCPRCNRIGKEIDFTTKKPKIIKTTSINKIVEKKYSDTEIKDIMSRFGTTYVPSEINITVNDIVGEKDKKVRLKKIL